MKLREFSGGFKPIKSRRLTILPNDNNLIINDVFCFSGQIKLVRLIYENEGFNMFSFFKIGDNVFKYQDVGIAYMNTSSAYTSKLKDIPLNIPFKTGNVFILESVNKIEKIELFIN